jgi:hypothetical protein
VQCDVSVPDGLWFQALSLADRTGSPSAVVQEALRRWVGFRRGYADAVRCAQRLPWRAIEELADRYEFRIADWAEGCADVAALAAPRAPAAGAGAGGARAELRDIVAAPGPAPGLLAAGGARLAEAGPGAAYLQGFVQAMRYLWSSVAGTASVPGDTADWLGQDWRDGLADCLDFYAAHGHLDVPARAEGARVRRFGAWVSRKRADGEAGILTAGQMAALEACGMQWQGVRGRNRQQMIAALRAFRSAHGHSDVPVTYVTRGGLHLGRWLADKKRTAQAGGQLHPETAAALRQSGAGWAECLPPGPPGTRGTGQEG